MYDKKLQLQTVEPETIYISKAERYELIALLAQSLQKLSVQVTQTATISTH
ncbi:MAG: hypothetical protein OEZ68_10785 [Gammaproteobacteria bacterium]|nr:hypothetical protein [Gammaproteobacteria bacterium]MDH5801278.1 hypothetical protein [Gammaproteobacteria bacterium]